METILRAHNELYNPSGERGSTSEEPSGERQPKQPRLELPESTISTYKQLTETHTKTWVSQLRVPFTTHHVLCNVCGPFVNLNFLGSLCLIRTLTST
jgi:hypothetical protein